MYIVPVSRKVIEASMWVSTRRWRARRANQQQRRTNKTSRPTTTPENGDENHPPPLLTCHDHANAVVEAGGDGVGADDVPLDRAADVGGAVQGPRDAESSAAAAGTVVHFLFCRFRGGGSVGGAAGVVIKRWTAIYS